MAIKSERVLKRGQESRKLSSLRPTPGYARLRPACGLAAPPGGGVYLHLSYLQDNYRSFFMPFSLFGYCIRRAGHTRWIQADGPLGRTEAEAKAEAETQKRTDEGH